MASRVHWTSRKYVERCRGIRDLNAELAKLQRVGMGKRQALDHVRKRRPELLAAAARTKPGA